jgi:DNA processing protein
METLQDSSLVYKLAVNLIPGIGGILAKKLIDNAGSPENIFRSDPDMLQKIPGIGKTLANSISDPEVLQKAAGELVFIKKYGIDALYYLDENYPGRLKECADSPVVLFIKGNVHLDNPKVISIVGTRNASRYGLEFCENLVYQLVKRGHNPLIVSGLAYGIDICAHKAALDNGLQTVAVLAHGLATIYPSAHRNTAERIIKQGALVTDFGSSIMPDKGNFLKRNRIIAGLADATIVVESSLKGGALITADLANSYNRDVFAVPGKLSDKMSQGCNNLIKTHKAALIESVEDIEYVLGWDPPSKLSDNTLQHNTKDLAEEEITLFKLLTAHAELTADEISEKTGFETNKTSYILLNLEFKGLITSLPGKIYKLATSF